MNQQKNRNTRNTGDEPVNVALAAFGFSGSVFHAPLITAHSGFRLKKVLERSGRRNAKIRYSDVETVQDFDAILADEEIELVVVNTPEYTHYELAGKALQAGKNVVVEKAFTVTSREAADLIRLAKEQNRVLSVFHNSRWHGDFLTVKTVINNGLLGELVEYEAHFDRYRNFIQSESWKEEPKPGTGSLYNLGSHMIDQALTLFGWPQSLMADVRIQRPGGRVCDNFELILNYEKLKVTLKSSYLVKDPGPRFILHGTEGSFVKYGTDPQEALLKAGRSPLEEGWGTEPKEQWGTLNIHSGGLHYEGRIETIPGSYLDFYRNIHNAIRKKEELLVKPEQALHTVRIIEAALKSQAEKRVIEPKPVNE